MIVGIVRYLRFEARPGIRLHSLFQSNNWEHPDQNRRIRSSLAKTFNYRGVEWIT